MRKKQNDTPLTEVDAKRIRRNAYIKMVAMVGIVAAVIAFGSIAWFTMNREVEGSGVQMAAADCPFELRTSGLAGLYDDYITSIDSNFSTDSETDGSNQKIIWQLTSDSQIENLWAESGTPSADDLRKIKKIESENYGLSPGDYGHLTFTIVPKSSDGFTATIRPVLSCYKTTYDNDGYQNSSISAMSASNADDAEAMNLLSGHILFFYKYDSDDDDEEEMHLINGSFNVEDITVNTDVTIYWVWPNKLSNILELTVDGLDETGCKELRKYFFTKPDTFLATTSSDGNDVFNGITLSASATDEQIEAAVSSMTSTVATYNGWIARYNNADQIVGDRVAYILLETLVGVQGE